MALDPYNVSGTNASTTAPWTFDTATSQISDAVVNILAGRNEFVGILLLLVLGFVLWRSNVGNDALLVVSVPLVLYAAAFGWIPGGQAVTAAVLLAAAALGTVAVGRLFR